MAVLSGFARRVLAAVRDGRWLTPGARCLAAVSGGADSTALAAALVEISASGELPLELCLAHFDHAIRPDSARDAEWVAELSRRLGCGFRTERGDVPALRAKERLTLEEAARNARLDFLERAAREWDARTVAVAHTADDQVETVLFRMLRGTGVNGLAGIPAERQISPTGAGIRLIRPMLGVTRREVIAYLESRKLEFLTDPTNRDVAGQARARIRHEVLPALEANSGTDVRGALLALAASARQTQEGLRHAAADALAGADISSGRARMPLGLLELPAALRTEALALAAERAGLVPPIPRGALARAAAMLAVAGLGARFETRLLCLERGYDELVLEITSQGGAVEARRRTAPRWSVPLTVPGETVIPGGRLCARIVERKSFDFDAFLKSKPATAEAFDARILERSPANTLVCRNRRLGDRFRPFGAPGEKKLKAFLIDQKLPRAERDRLPLVVAGDDILWAVGVRLSEKARVPADAARLVVVEFQPEQGNGG